MLWHCATLLLLYIVHGVLLHVVALHCRVVVHHAVALHILLHIIPLPWHWWQHCALCCCQCHAMALAVTVAVAVGIFALQAKRLGKSTWHRFVQH